MGYRTTFVTEDTYVELPDWFYDKWKDSVNFGVHTNHINKLEKPCFPLSSKWERKFYSGAQDELFLDIAKFILETKEPYLKEITLVLLHEDGEVDKVIITGDKVVLKRSLKYDPEDCYNWQLGDGGEEYVIPKVPLWGDEPVELKSTKLRGSQNVTIENMITVNNPPVVNDDPPKKATRSKSSAKVRANTSPKSKLAKSKLREDRDE